MATKIVVVTFVFSILFGLLLKESHCNKKKYAGKNWTKKGNGLSIKDDNIVKGLNNFALSLHRTMPQDGDLFYSPYGITNALGMAFAGSRGSTRDEIANALGWNNSTPKAVHNAFGSLLGRLADNHGGGQSKFLLANSVWVERQERVQTRFKRLIERYYGGKFGKVNFYGDPEGSSQKINYWVKLKTKGRIKDLIPMGAISKATRAILINAVYFKASWQTPFDQLQTKMRKFHMSSNVVKKIPMMEGYFKVPLLSSEDFTGIELPYEGERFSMIVLLPNFRNGLLQAEKNLDWDSLQKSYRGKRKMRVVLPKFKITSRYELADKLQSLGIKSLFSNDCDLSAMLKAGGDVFITNAIHKAFIVVNEKGTEASAATALFLGRSLIRDFIANRPFSFFIKDNAAKLILFAGRFSPM